MSLNEPQFNPQTVKMRYQYSNPNFKNQISEMMLDFFEIEIQIFKED